MRSDSADVLYRQTNLTFTLLDSSRPRDKEWVIENVDGYKGLSVKTLARDLQDLRSIGVPVKETSEGLSISTESYQLPPIEFSPAEATAIAMAGEFGRAGQLGAFARSGWTKLAASGARRDPSETFKIEQTTHNDAIRINPEVVARVSRAVAKQKRITFSYLATPTATPQTRTMDPWALVPMEGKIYLTGFDIDRDAPRSFRAIRVSDVRDAGPSLHTDIPELTSIVKQSFSRDLVDVVIQDSSGIRTVQQVDADATVRAAAAGELIILEPENLRQKVVELVERAL